MFLQQLAARAMKCCPLGKAPLNSVFVCPRCCHRAALARGHTGESDLPFQRSLACVIPLLQNVHLINYRARPARPRQTDRVSTCPRWLPSCGNAFWSHCPEPDLSWGSPGTCGLGTRGSLGNTCHGGQPRLAPSSEGHSTSSILARWVFWRLFSEHTCIPTACGSAGWGLQTPATASLASMPHL